MSILLKRNDTSGVIPSASELIPGELAINTVDSVLYTKNEAGDIIALASASDLPIPTTIAWENITGKPEFNLNSIPPENIIGTAVIDSDPRLIDSRDPLPHNHNISNIDGLQDALDGKSNTGHTHDGRYYTKTLTDSLLNNKANSTHSHASSDITDLSSSLESLENSVYDTINPVISGVQTDVQSLSSSLQSLDETISIINPIISGIQTDISDLQTGKQDAGDYALADHDHSYPNNVTKIGLNSGLNNPLIPNPDGLSSIGTTAIGFAACEANTTGYQNTGLGNVALLLNTTGYFNSAIGCLSLQYNTTGIHNTGTGACALRNQTTAQSNSGFGFGSLYNTTTGSFNSVIGAFSLDNNTVGNNNIAIGYSADSNSTNYNNCIIIGANATSYRSGDFVLGSSTNPIVVSTTVGSNGTASVLPANPLGYLEVRLNGTLVKIPYYRA